MIFTFPLLLAATLAAPLAQEPAKAPVKAPAQESATILETARSAGNFETLLSAAKAAGVDKKLQGKGPFTLLAPTDEAFAKLPKGTLEMLLEKKNQPLLEAVLLNHVLVGKVVSSDVATSAKRGWVETVGGQRIAVKLVKERLTLGEVGFLQTDLMCTNGVIHVVDTVLVPELADVVEIAVKAGNLKSLSKAFATAGLVEAMRAEGPFTILAPSDEAFAALPKGTIEELMKPENKDELVALLKNHVVAGRVYADQVVGTEPLTTLGGGTLKVAVSDDGTTLGGAKLVKSDLQARNGVIHVIDRVLLPTAK